MTTFMSPGVLLSELTWIHLNVNSESKNPGDVKLSLKKYLYIRNCGYFDA